MICSTKYNVKQQRLGPIVSFIAAKIVMITRAIIITMLDIVFLPSIFILQPWPPLRKGQSHTLACCLVLLVMLAIPSSGGEGSMLANIIKLLESIVELYHCIQYSSINSPSRDLSNWATFLSRRGKIATAVVHYLPTLNFSFSLSIKFISSKSNLHSEIIDGDV